MANFRKQTDPTGGTVSNFQAPTAGRHARKSCSKGARACACVGVCQLPAWTRIVVDRVSFSRGNKGWIAINRSSQSWSGTMYTGLPAGIV
jgi:hypothetical protein